MSKKVHYRDGCPWADGELQMADTRQTTKWEEVTCKHCLRTRSTRAALRGIALKIVSDQSFADTMREMLSIRRK